MGRFVTTVPARPQQGQPTQTQGYNQPQPNYNAMWPSHFPKSVIGIEREGVIIEDVGQPIKSSSQIKVIEGSLEAIKMMRLKGYKVLIINDQPWIQKGMLTTEEVDETNQHLMQVFGQAGILSIEGVLYSTSDLKEDTFAKPNNGMFKRAEGMNPEIKFKEGWYVGHNVKDAKAADKVGAIPVIVKTGNGNETLEKLDTFANKDLLKKTKVFNNLLEFAESLE